MESGLIEIKNITAFIGKTKVFDKFSLNIPLKKNTAVLGPNGSGKSSLLKLITREIYPVCSPESSLKILGNENWNIWDLRSQIGIISHYMHSFIFDCAKGKDVVLSGLFASPDIGAFHNVTTEMEKKADEILEFLGLSSLAGREFANMSTGQQRRLILGRALINEPQVLILDEPTSGLDIKACKQYIDLIRNLAANGKTIILVTHHIHEIPPEIDNIVFIKEGKIIAEGKKEKILTEEKLSSLFDVEVKLAGHNGFFQLLYKQ